MARKYENLAAEIIKNIGGVENVDSVSHCVTRLRFELKDTGKVNLGALKALDGVLTALQSGGQCQIVVGKIVSDVYEEILRYHGIQSESFANAVIAPKNLLDMFVGTVSGIFIPLLGVLAASGMLKSMLVLLTSFRLIDTGGGTYQILNVLSDAFFYFMPIFLGSTAAKNFRMSSEFTAMAIGAALVYPSLAQIRAGDVLYEVWSGTIFASPVHVEFFGLPVILMNYSSSIIPIILAVWVAAKIEKILLRIIPPIFKSFGLTFLMLLIMIPLTLLVVGPVSTWLGQIVGVAATLIFSYSPIIAGFLIGAFWQILVMFGLHWGLVPVMLNNITTLGYDSVVVTMFGASFAQIGVVLGIFLRTKDEQLKGIALPAFISGIFGITEPAIYSVTLPRQKFFILSCIGGAIGGVLVALLDVRLYIFGGMGIFEYPCFINPATNDVSGMYSGMIVSAVSFIAGLAMTLPLYRDEGEPDGEDLASPLTGKIVALENLPDERFAAGKGVAIEPTIGKVFAPADAEVITLFQTNHAIALKTDGGAEILIHIGLGTAQMNGEGFTAHVAQGDRVKRGQLLIEFDLDKIKAAGYLVSTPVLVVNADAFANILLTDAATINHGDKILATEI